MSIARRAFLNLMACAAAPLSFASLARAQTYPARPIRIVVGFPAGSGVDIVARLIGQWLAERMGQPVVVENRPGAGSNIATEAVVRAAPDGHTLLWVGSPNAISATLYDNLPFNFIRDVAPVAGINCEPSVVAVNPAVPAATLSEFIAYAKANPGKINMASAGNGTVSHVAGELFKMMTGTDMVHVPYRGGPSPVMDLVSGQVQVMFVTTSASLPHIKAGRLRALAVTTASRWNGLPDIPAVGEAVPGYEGSNCFGVGAPATTPADIVDRLNREINAGLSDPKVKARLAELGATALTGSSADFGRHLAAETEKWGKVVKFARLRAE